MHDRVLRFPGPFTDRKMLTFVRSEVLTGAPTAKDTKIYPTNAPIARVGPIMPFEDRRSRLDKPLPRRLPGLSNPIV